MKKLKTVLVTVTQAFCQHCKYKWTPRTPKPKACPKCKYYLQEPSQPTLVDKK